jgi:UDP-N-acetylglucosamine--N-acetylmuramyl-(pentapeptide) pyrophosphoryl-undecaprenol N-acetylglucosamine transferase
MRVVIAGGGTGGHVIPALAIGRELQARFGAELLFIGTSRGIETRLVPQAGFTLKLVEVGALKNVSPLTRVKTLTYLPRAVLAASKMLNDFHADVVIGVGGYASGPAMVAAILKRIPTLAFEPNAVPGFANRAVGRWVSAAAVHFEESRRYFKNAKVTGVPVRREFFDLPQQSEVHAPTLLITGGSQGARAINHVVCASLELLKAQVKQLFVIHQTGERDYNEVRAAYDSAGISAEIAPFIDDMPGAFARADVLLCRSGASTVAEVAAAGKVAIFVPFPFAADDHQLRNAEALASKGAALVLAERDLKPDTLVAAIANLVNDAERLKKMSALSLQQSHPEAVSQIAGMVEAIARKN